MPPSTLLRVNATVFGFINHASFSLSFGLMSLSNVCSSYWIFPEMSQKSAQPILASPQFWWILCWSLKDESTQPFVLGILSLFSVFCWMQQLLLTQLRRLVTPLAWVMVV